MYGHTNKATFVFCDGMVQMKDYFNSPEFQYLIGIGRLGINCNARTTCTNSGGVKPDLGLDPNKQCKMKRKTN